MGILNGPAANTGNNGSGDYGSSVNTRILNLGSNTGNSGSGTTGLGSNVGILNGPGGNTGNSGSGDNGAGANAGVLNFGSNTGNTGSGDTGARRRPSASSTSRGEYRQFRAAIPAWPTMWQC